MREIKFRAWDKDNQKMYDFAWVNLSAYPFQLVKEGFELLQYTGLKDKNGKEIYEGDIIKANLPYGNTFVVKWDEARASFMLVGINKQHFAAYDEKGYKMNAGKKEVIGNIYENPDMNN